MTQAAKQLSTGSLHAGVQHSIEQHLAMLISHDTCNPPREISCTDPLFVELEQFFKQQGFKVFIADFAHGRVAFYALRGQPEVLFNVHLDTVPVSDGWQHDPFSLTIEDGLCYGRGACDIKGAAACLMALAEQTSADMAVLFTTDEEGTNSCCVERFIAGHDLSVYQQVVVAEPTGCQAVLEHRGYVSAHGTFTGISGHSSSVSALTGNAVHQAGQWLTQATCFAANAQNEANPAGICFNLGYIKGGEKNNMIAEHCQLGFSVRVPAGGSSEAVYQQLTTGLENQASWHTSMLAPALPEQADLSATSLSFCQQHGLPVGQAVDFWTEAALFSQAGIPALVLGPGDIAQAHTVDEWVALEQLLSCYQLYAGLLT
jgi:acetylornithine deacetylase